MTSSWSSSAASAPASMADSMVHDSAAAMATGYAGASSYDTANWAPSETASASAAYGGGGGKAMDQCVQQCMAGASLALPRATSASSRYEALTDAPPPRARSELDDVAGRIGNRQHGSSGCERLGGGGRRRSSSSSASGQRYRPRRRSRAGRRRAQEGRPRASPLVLLVLRPRARARTSTDSSHCLSLAAHGPVQHRRQARRDGRIHLGRRRASSLLFSSSSSLSSSRRPRADLGALSLHARSRTRSRSRRRRASATRRRPRARSRAACRTRRSRSRSRSRTTSPSSTTAPSPCTARWACLCVAAVPPDLVAQPPSWMSADFVSAGSVRAQGLINVRLSPPRPRSPRSRVLD